MNVVQLTSSRFFGGPERQMLELARALPRSYQTTFLSFSEGGHCEAFLDEVRQSGLDAAALKHDTPRFRAVLRELTGLLRDIAADVLCCHGYKADVVGLLAGRRLGIPVVGISRGWTAENLRVKAYEAIDRRALRWMDRVVCVSGGQARKVLKAGVSPAKVSVIHNAIRTERFERPSTDARKTLSGLFARPPRHIVGAAGRLSPEKGFAVLVDAAARLVREQPTTGFVLFGDGALRESLALQIQAAGLADRFLLPGFRRDLDELLPAMDVFALPSYTEGLPNVVLESFAAGVPVVATAVGGTPELVDDGVSGRLVPAGDPTALADGLLEFLISESRRRSAGKAGRLRVREDFTFESQSENYQQLFNRLVPHRGSIAPSQVLQKVG